MTNPFYIPGPPHWAQWLALALLFAAMLVTLLVARWHLRFVGRRDARRWEVNLARPRSADHAWQLELDRGDAYRAARRIALAMGDREVISIPRRWVTTRVKT